MKGVTVGGFFGLVSRRSALEDVYYGTDYLSHLGTHRAGIACYDPIIGLQREIHDIEDVPFRTRFEHIFSDMEGNAAVGSISDFEPQPLLIRSRFGVFALCFTGLITNQDELVEKYLSRPGAHFDAMTGGRVNSCELIAALINLKETMIEGLCFAQEVIQGTASILILQNDGTLIAARDKMGRIPVMIGHDEDGTCVSFESFAYKKLGYEDFQELGPGEIVLITADHIEQVQAPRPKKKICAFLWTYYGYPASTYEGVNVEKARYANGRLMARQDQEVGKCFAVDHVGGVPDSGVGHALGYAFESGIPYGRAIVKYPTWYRSFTPSNQRRRNRVAKMKQVPVYPLIHDQSLLFVDDSIVRGTQLHGTVDFLQKNGAREIHMRSACPPTMYPCKYLNFSRSASDLELLSRRTILRLEGQEGFDHLDEYASAKEDRGQAMRQAIAEEFHFSSLEFQSLENLIESIGLPECDLCTYCWNGRE